MNNDISLPRDLGRDPAAEPDYVPFLTAKIAAARLSAQAGRGIAAEDVEREFAARRDRLALLLK